MTLLISLSLSISLLFFMFVSPLSLAILIVAQSITVSILVVSLASVSWFTLIFLMVFISGMMIVFMYVSSLATNKITKMKKNYMKMTMMLVFATLIVLSASYSESTNLLSSSLTIMKFTTFSSLKVFPVYSVSMAYMTNLMVLYLLFVLVVVIKSATMTSGPLRSAI